MYSLNLGRPFYKSRHSHAEGKAANFFAVRVGDSSAASCHNAAIDSRVDNGSSARAYAHHTVSLTVNSNSSPFVARSNAPKDLCLS
jgi:hypothetical protein